MWKQPEIKQRVRKTGFSGRTRPCHDPSRTRTLYGGVAQRGVPLTQCVLSAQTPRQETIKQNEGWVVCAPTEAMQPCTQCS